MGCGVWGVGFGGWVVEWCSFQFKNDYIAKIWSGSEEGSYLRLIDVASLNSRLESNEQKMKVWGVRCGG